MSITEKVGHVNSVGEIKSAAAGKWSEILPAVTGIDCGLLDGKNHPCPKCGGKDRFRMIDIAAGSLFCNQCFDKQNGDGLAAIQWLQDCDFPTVLSLVANHLGIKPNGNGRVHVDVVEEMARRKNITVDSLAAFGAISNMRGDMRVCRVPMYDTDMNVVGHFDMAPTPGMDKGKMTQGSKHGLFVVESPKLSTIVLLVEGVKDAAALHNLGYVAVGLPTCRMAVNFARFFRGVHVVIIPDRDKAGIEGAKETAARLHGVAESVKVAELPGDYSETGGADVRDVLRTRDGEAKVRDAIKNAREWQPETKQEKWQEIKPFDAVELPSFPTHALPGVLRAWVEAESLATQTPADLAGLLALATCSATIARHVIVEPRPGWREPVNLFVAVLLEPGNRKSAVFADAVQPLRELEAELIEEARPTIAREQSDRRQAEARLKKMEKLAAEKGDPEARHEAGDLAAELAEQPEPVLPRLVVDDATSEKLGMMLFEQGGRIASMSPEGGVFDLMAGLYSKSGIPQFGVYLMGHSGDDLATDRVSRKSVCVVRPALTCAYAIQPAVIEGLAEQTAFRGRGLLARFLYAFPKSWIGRREIAPEPVPEATREAYRQTVRAMAESFQNIQSDSEPLVLQLSSDATALLYQWETEIEEMLDDGGPMEIMRDWGAKLAGAALRLAAVLHCVEHNPELPIDRATIMAAVEIARYLIPHTEAVLNLMRAKDGPGADDAHYLLRWIERHDKRQFKKSEAQQHGKRRFPKADDIDPALNELTRRGYVRLVPSEPAKAGRPPSPTYEVNPAFFDFQNTGKRSVYSKNSTDLPVFPPDGGNLQNIQSAFGQMKNEISETGPDSRRANYDSRVCPHTNVAEEPTFDGYVNTVCADCGKTLSCRKQEQSA